MCIMKFHRRSTRRGTFLHALTWTNRNTYIEEPHLTIFLEKFCFLEYESAFLELLSCIIGLNIFPPQILPTFAAVEIADTKKTSYQLFVLFLPQHQVHRMTEHVSRTGFSLNPQLRKKN